MDNPDFLDKPEVEIFPGVFMTDFRNKTANPQQRQQQQTQSVMTLGNNVIPSKEELNPSQFIEVHLFEIKRLDSSLLHLKRSNEEMEEFLKQEYDVILVESIEENHIVIEKQIVI